MLPHHMLVRSITTTKTVVKSRGIGSVEFALVLPLLLLLFLGGIEFTNAISKSSALAALAREVADAGFRDCTESAYVDLATLSQGQITSRINATRSCLEATIQNSSLIDSSGLANAKLVLSVYKWREPSGPALAFGQAMTDGSYPSKLNDQSFLPHSVRGDLLKAHGVLLFSEVYFEYSPLVPYISSMFGHDADAFYVATFF